MMTVASRSIASCPLRDAAETWQAIIDLLTHGKPGDKRDELAAISGVASSIITDRYPVQAAITVTCDGPRSRIYCLYDDDAIDGSDAKEDPFGFDPLNGDWQLSLPCHPDDLYWVQAALARKGTRITARDLTVKVEAAARQNQSEALELDVEGFLGL